MDRYSARTPHAHLDVHQRAARLAAALLLERPCVPRQPSRWPRDVGRAAGQADRGRPCRSHRCAAPRTADARRGVDAPRGNFFRGGGGGRLSPAPGVSGARGNGVAGGLRRAPRRFTVRGGDVRSRRAHRSRGRASARKTRLPLRRPSTDAGDPREAGGRVAEALRRALRGAFRAEANAGTEPRLQDASSVRAASVPSRFCMRSVGAGRAPEHLGDVAFEGRPDRKFGSRAGRAA